ncbi:TPA: molecular chaperone [Enterobacter asburiae]|nr:molecular chaperone [Enterobacter asburiae]
MTRQPLYFSVMIALLSCPVAVLADGFGINATRLIYPQGADSITVSVRNTQSTSPYLVQVAVSQAPDRRDTTPFTATPPVFRLEPKSEHQVRIVGKGMSLPTDRESVFYFNATATPAIAAPMAIKQNADIHAAVQFGVGNIIKLFYRPAGLSSTSEMAQKNLKFTPVNNGLQVSNPSPYFVSLASIKFAGQTLKLDSPAALMIAPFGSHTYPTTVRHGRVTWQTLNDLGGIDEFKNDLP